MFELTLIGSWIGKYVFLGLGNEKLMFKTKIESPDKKDVTALVYFTGHIDVFYGGRLIDTEKAEPGTRSSVRGIMTEIENRKRYDQ